MSFFPDGSGPPRIQISQGPRGSYPRRLIFMIRRFFKDLSKSAYGALVRVHLEYGMPVCSLNIVADNNHLERIERLTTRLVTSIRHLPYKERLQWRRLRADLITAFMIFTGLNIDSNLLFLPPTRRGLRGHYYKVVQGASLRRRRVL